MVSPPSHPDKLSLQNRQSARMEIDTQIEKNQKFVKQLKNQYQKYPETQAIFDSAVHQIEELKKQNPYTEEYHAFNNDEIDDIKDYLNKKYIEDYGMEKSIKRAYLIGKEVSVLTKENKELSHEKKLKIAHQVKVLQDLSGSKGILNRIRFWWNYRKADKETKEALRFFRDRSLDTRGIQELKKQKQAVQDKIIDIIRNAELQTVKEAAKKEAEVVGGSDADTMAKKVQTILRRKSETGIRGAFFRFWYDRTVQQGSKTELTLSRTVNALREQEHQDPDAVSNPFYEKVKGKFVENPNTQLAKRAGVVGFGEIYRIQHTFSKKKLAKQLRSFYVQELTKETRHRIESTIQDKEGHVYGESRFVPLNREMDDYINELLPGESSSYITMGNLYAEIGIAAADRTQPGLINGYLSELRLEREGGQAEGESLKNNLPDLRFLRFGLIADQFETDPEIRELSNKEIAKEALTAAVMLHLAENGLNPDDVLEEKPLEINYSHVSIVTPTKLSRFLATQDKKLLKEHIQALKSFEEGTHRIQIGDAKIPVKFNVQTYNFGVNIGALGFNSWLAPKFGTRFQHRINKKNWNAFQTRALEPFLQKLDLDIQKHPTRINSELVPDDQLEAYRKEQDELVKIRQTITALRDDLETLMRSKDAYQEGGMQFEAPAKILLLMNEMNKVSGSSFKSSFGCYSDKDRSGVQDVVLKVFEEMRLEDGHYPTHEELRQPEKQARFLELYKTFIKTSGNLEIPRINTGVPGIKWDKVFNFWPEISKKLKAAGRAGITSKTEAKITGLSKTAKT